MSERVCGFEVHEAARRFPLLKGPDREQLADSMRAHGWMRSHPAVTYEGMLLDGRNRMIVAEKLGISPVTVEWDGEYGDPWVYVFATNIVRRHLSDATKARLALMFEKEIAAQMAKKKADNLMPGNKRGRKKDDLSKRPNGPNEKSPTTGQTTAAVLAETAGISPRTLKRAKRVLAEAPSLYEKVERGEMSMAAAEREVKGTKAPGKKPPPRDAGKNAVELRRHVVALVRDLKAKYPKALIIQALELGLYEARK